MPEGNEIHRYAEMQDKFFGGGIVRVDAPNKRFAEGAKQLNGRKLRSVEGFGKHLIYDFGKDRHLHVHLGLYGKFKDGEMPYPEPRGALRMRISNASHWLELRGPTACDVLKSEATEALLERIGPDPLRDDADVKRVIGRITRSRAPIAALLMDQSVVGGVGNIYRAELLYRSRINPFAPGLQVTAKQVSFLWKEAKALMRDGMVDRRIVTTRPADRPHPKGKARRFETHYVYRRQGQPCIVCQADVQMKDFMGRKLYWCPQCQAGDGKNKS